MSSQRLQGSWMGHKQSRQRCVGRCRVPGFPTLIPGFQAAPSQAGPLHSIGTSLTQGLVFPVHQCLHLLCVSHLGSPRPPARQSSRKRSAMACPCLTWHLCCIGPIPSPLSWLPFLKLLPSVSPGIWELLPTGWQHTHAPAQPGLSPDATSLSLFSPPVAYRHLNLNMSQMETPVTVLHTLISCPARAGLLTPGTQTSTLRDTQDPAAPRSGPAHGPQAPQSVL